MKILESYKEMANELLAEGNLGQNPHAQGKKPQAGDWWQSSEGQDYAMGKDGKRQGPFNDEKEAEEYAKGQVGGDEKDGEDGEDSAGKLSGPGDFERDSDDSEPEDKPFGGDTGRDADSDEQDPYDTERGAYDAERGAKGKYDDYGDPIEDEPEDEPEDDDSMGDKQEIADIEAEIAQAEEWLEDSKEEVRQARKMGDDEEWQEASKLYNDDRSALRALKGDLKSKQAKMGGGHPGAPKNEVTINGKQYRAIKESKQHILKENYDRFFGDK